jgi:hypothetical protein
MQFTLRRAGLLLSMPILGGIFPAARVQVRARIGRSLTPLLAQLSP